MATTSRERQRKWKENQTTAGKRAVTVMLAPDIKDLIDKERKRTGETIAGIIEKAVVKPRSNGKKSKKIVRSP